MSVSLPICVHPLDWSDLARLPGIPYNAVKYSPDGGRVEVELVRSPNETFQLAVRDWGAGIPQEHRAHIFDRFHQVIGQHRTSGMGLGLYISRQIIELHGGKIEVEFPEDGGTRFVATLPSGIAPAARETG
jgi:signal transduction histidine kinase